jgi:secreted trypsin-like serine protease
LRDLGNHHLCSGAIITKRWVLTVAGCTQFRGLKANEIKVIAGTRRRDESATPFDVVEIVNHPFFNWNTLNNE